MVSSYEEFLKENSKCKVTITNINENGVTIQSKLNSIITDTYTYEYYDDFLMAVRSYLYVTNISELAKIVKLEYKDDYEKRVQKIINHTKHNKIIIQKIDNGYIYTDRPIKYNERRVVYLFPEFLRSVYFYVSNPAILKSYFDKYTNKTTKLLDIDKLFFDEIRIRFSMKDFLSRDTGYEIAKIVREYLTDGENEWTFKG